jgi:hypothetical protein
MWATTLLFTCLGWLAGVFSLAYLLRETSPSCAASCSTNKRTKQRNYFARTHDHRFTIITGNLHHQFRDEQYPLALDVLQGCLEGGWLSPAEYAQIKADLVWFVGEKVQA